VDEDPVDPRREARGAPEGARPAVDLQEGLLDRVFRVGDVPEQVRGDALHSGPVELVEALECGHVARAASLEQPLLLPRLTRAIRFGQDLLLREKGDLGTILQRRAKTHLFFVLVNPFDAGAPETVVKTKFRTGSTRLRQATLSQRVIRRLSGLTSERKRKESNYPHSQWRRFEGGYMAKLARILLAGLFLLVPFASGILAQSQATTGVIEGAVLDASGGALPGATVTIRNTGTGFEHVVTTDTQGRFRVVQLPLGPYRVT